MRGEGSGWAEIREKNWLVGFGLGDAKRYNV
jgi:hypothetical protein